MESMKKALAMTSVTFLSLLVCGNGFATNPEPDVIDLLVKERKKAFPNKAFTQPT